MENKTISELAEEVKTAHAKAFDSVREIAEKALSEAQKNNAVTEKTKQAADEALIKMNELGEELRSVEQQLVRFANLKTEADQLPKSLGEAFVASEKVDAFLKSVDRSGKVDFVINGPIMGAKASIISTTDNSSGAAGSLVAPTRLPGILPIPDERLTVRGLISPGNMDSNLLEYVVETGFTNNAAPVAEGALKPQSDIKFDLRTTTPKVIAHWMHASRQILDDAAALRSQIDYRLRYGLAMVEERQILFGDGTGQNLHGIIPQASAFSPAIALSSPTPIELIRLAMLQSALAEFPATGIVMNPIDWTYIELMKDGEGRLVMGNPQTTVAPRLWGLPVVETKAMPQDKFLTGAFRLGAQIFDRWLSRIEVATQNNDDFVRNMVTILAEERLALAVYRPEAFVYGDLGRIA